MQKKISHKNTLNCRQFWKSKHNGLLWLKMGKIAEKNFTYGPRHCYKLIALQFMVLKDYLVFHYTVIKLYGYFSFSHIFLSHHPFNCITYCWVKRYKGKTTISTCLIVVSFEEVSTMAFCDWKWARFLRKTSRMGQNTVTYW